MAFDEHLRRVFDAALAELIEAARAEEERVRSDAHAAGRAEGHAQGHEEGHAAGLAAGHVTGLDEGRSQGFEDGHAKGLEEGHAKGREEGHAHGLEEGRAQGWEDGREHGRVEAQQDTKGFDRLLDGIRAIDRARSLTEVLDTTAACAAREGARAGVLLVRNGALRAWRFIGFDASLDAETFETAMADAGVVADAIAGGAIAASDAVPVFAQPGDARAVACPLAIAGEVVAVLYADGVRSEAPLEALGRHAARALESLTALKAARALTQPTPETSANDGDDSDASARRYARLLVSEIKLYHEPAVIAGRRDRDLAQRLGGEIARARVLYDQRVPPAVRQRSDYFKDELVRTLANGDATLLQLS